jgi:hypothetical protein
VKKLRDLSDSELFLNGNTRGSGPRCHRPARATGSTVDRAAAWTFARWSTVGAWCAGRCGPPELNDKAKEEEGDKAVRMRG